LNDALQKLECSVIACAHLREKIDREIEKNGQRKKEEKIKKIKKDTGECTGTGIFIGFCLGF
jgi:hypothetical protein